MEGGFIDVQRHIEIIDEKLERIGLRQNAMEDEVKILQKNNKGKEKAAEDDATTKDDYAPMDNDHFSGERYCEEENFGFGEGSSAARYGDDMKAEMCLGAKGFAGVEVESGAGVEVDMDLGVKSDVGVEADMGLGIKGDVGVEADISLGAEHTLSLDPTGSWALGPPIPLPMKDLPPLSPRQDTKHVHASGSIPSLSFLPKKSGLTPYKMCYKKNTRDKRKGSFNRLGTGNHPTRNR